MDTPIIAQYYRETEPEKRKELLEQARLETGSLFVVGCSSSEVTGHKIGSIPID